MRKAVQEQYKAITGHEPDFCFSGWAGELTEGERAVVENRPPAAPSPTLREKQLRELAEKWRHDFSSPCCSLEYGHYPKECKRCQVEELLGLPLSLPKGLGTSEASVLATLAQGDGK